MPQAKKSGRRRGASSGNQNWLLWVVVAVVVLAGLFMLARTLSTAPPPVAIIPVLASANPDLETLTRMMGDITLDSTIAAGLPEETRTTLRPADSLIAMGDWPEALKRLLRLRKPAKGRLAAVLDEYIGYCRAKSTSLDHALHHFRQAMVADSGRSSELNYRLSFNAGYLFQSRGYADSALALYTTARHFAPADSLDPLLPALRNNLGLALETTGDTAQALEFYRAAAELVDTTLDLPASRTVRDNLRRVNR